MATNRADTFLRQFNETIEKWINYLDNYTLEMLYQRPHPESWSLGQVYIHIIDDTKYFIEQTRLALLNNGNSQMEMHEDFKAIFERNAFPDAKLGNPSNSLNLRQPQSKEELLHELLLIKEAANTLYAAVDFSKSNGKTEHPGLRFFNAAEWLQFAEMHMRHHFRQKNRIDDELFPA